MILLSLFSELFVINYVYSAKILGIFHGVAYSHQTLGNKLLHELAARGHEVTSIAPKEFAPKKPIKNLKIIPLDFEDIMKQELPNMFDEFNSATISKIIFMDVMGVFFTETTLNQTSVQELLKSDQKFDLVIMEQFINEAFKGFCYHFKAHCVMLSTVGSSRWTNPQMGNPHFPSYMPEIILSLPSKMNFFQRLHNNLAFAFSTLLFYMYTLPKHNEILHKYFPDAPHINELYYNTSLMLLNSHPSINPPTPYVPNMIDIGGYHIDPPKGLPADLQEFLDKAKHGVIYFSMGSHIEPQTMPEHKLNAIIKVLSKLKQNVLWKWTNDTLRDQPSNVKISKWLPQQDILAHPNVVLFISHGGLLSTIETVYHGKPIVGIPILGDQQMNIANAELNGFAKAVPFNDLTEDLLESTIKEVLNNSKYAEVAKMKSKILNDQPMKPLDKAMFWIEYVIRHNGAPHLRTSALNLKWYQLDSTDVIVFSILVLVVIVYTFYKVCKIIINLIFRQNKTKAKKHLQKHENKKKQN